MSASERQESAVQTWFERPRFDGIVRLHTAADVVAQQGTIANEYTVARDAADAFYERLRELFDQRKSITTYGPYSPGQAVTMKRMGIEGIYLGGWATSAKGSLQEDPGPDLASYPLSQVPNEAAVLVRALLTADRNQHYQRLRMSEEARQATPAVDYRPFIIADADTGHGGDAHVRNLVRRFVEAGVPGYHIEDQRPGAKKCGHQAGKVLVGSDEQIKRLNGARFQLDVMKVAGIVVARTDAESATFLESSSDERDQPFILGATNPHLPTYKAGYMAILRRLFELGVDGVRGHLLSGLSEVEYDAAYAWFDRVGLTEVILENARLLGTGSSITDLDAALNRIEGEFMQHWRSEAGLKTYAEAVADVLRYRTSQGEQFETTADEWLAFAARASLFEAKSRARALGIELDWDAEPARTPDGFYQVQGGIDYAIVKSLAAAPFADLLWMETKTADLADARRFAEAIHAVYPDQMLSYNLSPSFNWDTTGMSDEEMTRFPEELGKMGYVFNFITYGGHQIDGLAAEEFSTALLEDGMLALARLQRKFRLLESPYRTPQTLVGGPRLDGTLMAVSGRTAATKAMGKGSTQYQHLVQTEVSPKVLDEWLELWRDRHSLPERMHVELRPQQAGSELLELAIVDQDGQRLADCIFADLQDRRRRNILSVRNQHTVPRLRRKRLSTLIQLFLFHRYKTDSVHYVTPSEDNEIQTRKMKDLGIFTDVNTVAQIIVADVNKERIAQLVAPGREELMELIQNRVPQGV